MTRFLTATGLGLLFLSVISATAASIDSRPVFYHAHNGLKISGYLAEPGGPGPFPAVILIHEWWGLNDDIRLKARNDLGVRASVIYYGPFNPDDDFRRMRAAILGHFAEKDRSIALEDVQQLEVVLKNRGIDHALFIYPNTTHGFASRPQANPGYSPKAAYEAWQRTLAFLQRTLKD